MKLLGFSLCVLGFFGAGIRATKQKSSQMYGLRALCCALELMRGELSARACSIPVLCDILRERSDGCAVELFRLLGEDLSGLGEEHFAEIWAASVQCVCGFLPRRDWESLAALGLVLGRYDLETQLLAVERCEHRLRQRLEQMENAYPNERRLLLGLGAAAGMLLGVLLL